MDHLGIDTFMVLGFCIGGPFIWNIIERAPSRVAAAVIVQPVGFRPENPNVMYDASLNGWGAELVKRRPDITRETVQTFVTKMFRTDADFVFTVSRDFVRNCQTPALIMPDDVPSHPYAVAMESAMLAPKSEVSIYPGRSRRSGSPSRCARYGPSSGRIDLGPRNAGARRESGQLRVRHRPVKSDRGRREAGQQSSLRDAPNRRRDCCFHFGELLGIERFSETAHGRNRPNTGGRAAEIDGHEPLTGDRRDRDVLRIRAQPAGFVGRRRPGGIDEDDDLGIPVDDLVPGHRGP